MWNLRNKTNEQRKKKETNKQKTRLLNTENKLVIVIREVDREMVETDKGDYEIQTSSYKINK